MRDPRSSKSTHARGSVLSERGLVLSERGSVLVESALVLPLLVMFLLGSVDVGMWVFQTTQAASAARSGARAGILRYRAADQIGSDDNNAIRLAVARDVGAKPGISIQVTCVGPDDVTVLPTGCVGASVVSPDRISVRVGWDRPSLTFLTESFGVTQRISGAAIMVINGRPPSVVP